MSRYKDAEEVRKQHIKSMGEELGTIFHALWNEVAWICMKWNQYVELFGKKPSRISLLNSAAPLFFRIVQDSLFEDTLIHIARLTDPVESFKKHNLTILRLSGLLPDGELKNNITELIDVALQKADFSRDWRNRRIAHKDLKLALKEGAEPLKKASRIKVWAALDAIAKVMNAVSMHYMDQTIMFEGIPSPHGAVALLYVIDDGLQVEKERMERLKSGQYRAADHKVRDL
ncbi:hypothetical protein ACFL6B_01955 [Thermodesulfobacteriota bacterium]